ncbi:unnamed protein product [Lupinus luteus]|uniref:Uncharacterized protein n=1 Tax=Lupinus luteus TaxID=3873 RepID=A0AAV1YE38_LUPLU
MNNFPYFVKSYQHHLHIFPLKTFFNFHGYLSRFILLFPVKNPFLIELCYFIILSLLGYLGLKFSKPRTHVSPNDLDLFYTSVSASTVSSMAALEMEIFSNFQLILLTFLMLAGGEVYISMLELVIATQKFKRNKLSSTLAMEQKSIQIELGLVSIESSKHSHVPNVMVGSFNDRDTRLKYNSLRYLLYIIIGYLVLVHLLGSSLVSLYISFIPSARRMLKNKGIKIQTFSFFIIVSSFANCGFVPTNENMIVFKNNSGLLLLIIPHILLGNTLYVPCLRLVIWLMKKVTRRDEFSYLLNNSKEVGYDHLLPSSHHCWLLFVTVLGLNLIQLVMFCSMEWNTKNMEGLNIYQKVVASMFQVINARHSGESVFDFSSISSAILVLFIVMMYLPPNTVFLPAWDHENETKDEKRSLTECLVFSQLSYLVIFIILICITESQSLREDPLNFNVLNITIEVISAYGNVGFTTGYSCTRQVKADAMCKDSYIGFSGKWSSQGKFILIVVMFFGRLKKFNMNGGKAWHLS